VDGEDVSVVVAERLQLKERVLEVEADHGRHVRPRLSMNDISDSQADKHWTSENMPLVVLPRGRERDGGRSVLAHAPVTFQGCPHED